MIKGVIFDLDGTLLNTLDNLASCYNRILDHNGYQSHAASRYKMFIGNGAMRCLKACLEESNEIDRTSSKELDALLEQQQMDYEANWKKDVEIYEGVIELLVGLSNQKLVLGVLSNKDHGFVNQCVDEFFGSSVFEYSQGYSDTVPHKPNPIGALALADRLGLAPDTLVMVGDTRMDIETAKTAGFKSIGVLWGFRDRAELETAGADFIVNTPMEILDLPLFTHE